MGSCIGRPMERQQETFYILLQKWPKYAKVIMRYIQQTQFSIIQSL